MSVSNHSTYAAQIDASNEGGLRIQVTSTLGMVPVPDASVTIYYADNPESPIQTLTTDISGQTPIIELPAPPVSYSLEPGSPRPYSEYAIQVIAPGYETVVISGSEILPNVTSIQPVELPPLEVSEEDTEEDINIGPHTLYYDYPPKIPEEEIKPMDETGEIVLSRVVIPEFIIVHDGVPDDSTAPNYYVRYKDYIKNVASSEIYATWPESAIYANILAIMSFTLNRVYTEWYRNTRWFRVVKPLR